jgi:hypothetical protein
LRDPALQTHLRECFDYDPETGLFRWRKRPVDHFVSEWACDVWNSRWAGTPAFTVKCGKRGVYRVGRFSYEGKYRKMLAHVAAWIWMTGDVPEQQIDHKNGQPADNRFDNLRPASQTQQNWNRVAEGPYPKGVYKPADKKRFMAQAHINGKNTYLGYYDTPEEAHAAWIAAVSAADERGEFLRVA